VTWWQQLAGEASWSFVYYFLLWRMGLVPPRLYRKD